MRVQDAEFLPCLPAQTLWKILTITHRLHATLDSGKLPDLLTSGLSELIANDECSLGIQGLDSVGLVDDRRKSVGIQPPHLCPLPLGGGEGRIRGGEDGALEPAATHRLTMAGRIGGTVGYELVLGRNGGSQPFGPGDARVLDLIRPHWEIAMANALALAGLSRTKELAEKALRLDGSITLIAASDGSVLYATERASLSFGLESAVDGLPPELFPAFHLSVWLAGVLSPSPRRGGRAPRPKRLSSRASDPSPWPSPQRGEGKERKGVPPGWPYLQEMGVALPLGKGASISLPAAGMRGSRGTGIRTRAFHLDGWGSLRLIEIVEDAAEEDIVLRLSRREAEIAGAIAAGLRNSEAARMFGVSVETVRKVLARIYARCGLASRAELAAELCGGSLSPAHSAGERVNR